MVMPMPSARYATAIMGTRMDEIMLMRFDPPKITNAVITISTMPNATAVPLVA